MYASAFLYRSLDRASNSHCFSYVSSNKVDNANDRRPPHIQHYASSAPNAFQHSSISAPALALPHLQQQQPSRISFSNPPSVALSTPSSSTNEQSNIVTSSPDVRSSPCPPYRKQKNPGYLLPAFGKEICHIEGPFSRAPTISDVTVSQEHKGESIAFKIKGSQVRVKAEPKVTILNVSDSANQNNTKPSSSSTSTIPLSRAIIEDLQSIWDANPSVPTVASRAAWAEARGLPRGRVHAWFTNKRTREKSLGRPHAGTYDLPVDAPLIEDANVTKKEIVEVTIPQVALTTNDTRQQLYVARSRGMHACSGENKTETPVHPRETPNPHMSSLQLCPPLTQMKATKKKVGPCDNSQPPSIGSKRQLVSGSQMKVCKRQKTKEHSTPNSSYAHMSNVTQCLKTKAPEPESFPQSQSEDSRRTEKENERGPVEVKPPEPSFSGPNGLWQTITNQVDISSRSANSTFIEGHAAGLEQLVGCDNPPPTNNTGRLRAKISNESSGTDPCFGLNDVWPQVRLSCYLQSNSHYFTGGV